MAARVAATLKREGIDVESVAGGFGEFSVFVDDRKVIDTSKLWYPSPRKVVEKVRTLVAERDGVRSD